MNKKHYIAIAICTMIMLISGALYAYYYREYIKPKSYTIGSIKPQDYTALTLKDYLSNDIVLFSQNLDDITFKNDNGTASYEFVASPIEFNGKENDYIIYVNDYMLTNVSEDAGSISGTYTLKYYDIDKSIIKTSNIQLSFASYTKSLVFKITLPTEDTGLLMRYFELNEFIVTLAYNPYSTIRESVYNITVVNSDGIDYTTLSINGESQVVESDTTYYVGYNDEVSLQSTVKTGFTFKGWYNDIVISTENLLSSSEIYSFTASSLNSSSLTIYAMTLANTYTVVYDSNGGTGTMSNSTHNYEVARALNTCNFSRTGYIFAGWSTIADGEVEYVNGASVKNLTDGGAGADTITLYAVWTFDGTTLSNDWIEYDSSTSSYYVTKGTGTLSGRVLIPETYDDGVNGKASVTSICNYAFNGCNEITSITIPDTVTSIGNYAFEYCTNLSTITILDSSTLASIGNYAFYNCRALANILIPASVTKIGQWAFFESGLTSATFNSVDTWKYTTSSDYTGGTDVSSTGLSDTAIAAKYLTDTVTDYYWYK